MEFADVASHHLIVTLSHILLFFGIAGLAVPLFQRFRIPPILGYLLCGIAIGPHGFSSLTNGYTWLEMFTIQDTATVYILGELGIVSLMFMIGLELSIDRLRELRRYIFGLGTAQILVTACLIFSVSLYFDNSVKASVLLGMAFALSSTAIVMKLLEEKHLTTRPVGVLSFSILLMQDLAVVPILVLASSFAGGGEKSIIENIVISLGIGVAVVVGIFLLGQHILKFVLQHISVSHSAEWLASFTVFIVIACAALTHSAGLSLALGAFLAGLLIAETEFRHEIEVIFAPVKGMLLGIFFLSIGMMIDVGSIFLKPIPLIASVLGIYLLKSLVLFPLCLLFNVPKKKAFQTSLYLAQPGEFALLLLGVALSAQIIPQQEIQFFYLVTVVAMMLSPVLFKIAPLLTAKLFPDREENSLPQDIPQPEENFVLIAGFGRVGQLLADALQIQHISYIAFDQNAQKVRLLKEKGYRVIYGDARKIELWHSLNQGNAIAAVIAIDNYEAVHNMVKALRAEWPFLPVIVRSQDTAQMNAYYDLGAKYVVAETLESSLRMASLVMIEAGGEEKDVEKIVEKLRDKNTALPTMV